MSLIIPPFAGVATPTWLATNDRVRITTALTALLNVIPNPSADPAIATTYAPDFDEIPPRSAAAIRLEINAAIIAFNATAVLTATTNTN